MLKSIQKQPPEVFYKKKVFLKIPHKSQVNKHLCQSLFFFAPPATLLKKRLQHRCFPVNFAKFLSTTFLQNTPLDNYFCQLFLKVWCFQWKFKVTSFIQKIVMPQWLMSYFWSFSTLSYLGPYQTSMMEFYSEIFNGF